MENIIRYPTKTTPFVYTNFEKGIILFSGISIPENSPQFFAGLNDWIITFLENETKTLSIHFDFDYYNTSTSLSITSILMILDRYKEKSIQIYWHYFSDDDDLFEDGEDFASISKCPFELVESANNASLSMHKTEKSPLIYLDSAGDFILSGNCVSENPMQTFHPALKWLNARRLTNSPTSVKFEIFATRIDQQNLPFLSAMLATLDIYQNKGIKTSVTWKYSNSEIEQLGIEMLSNYSFHYHFKQEYA